MIATNEHYPLSIACVHALSPKARIRTIKVAATRVLLDRAYDHGAGKTAGEFHIHPCQLSRASIGAQVIGVETIIGGVWVGDVPYCLQMNLPSTYAIDSLRLDNDHDGQACDPDDIRLQIGEVERAWAAYRANPTALTAREHEDAAAHLSHMEQRRGRSGGKAN